MRGTEQLDHVDGLRAVAVLAVLVYHIAPAWLPSGFVGVDVFFVISGFVVARALSAHAGAPRRDFFLGFYARRALRLLPALLLVLVCTAAVWAALIPKLWMSNIVERTNRLAFFGLSNWALAKQTDSYFAPVAEMNPFVHTWSLGVEEQFYLLTPLALFMYWRSRGNQWRGWFVTLALSFIVGASLVYSAQASARSPLDAFYLLPSRLWELGVGVIWSQPSWRGGGGRPVGFG